MALRMFDSHCHLQDPRIISMASDVIRKAQESGVVKFAVNGTSEVIQFTPQKSVSRISLLGLGF